MKCVPGNRVCVHFVKSICRKSFPNLHGYQGFGTLSTTLFGGSFSRKINGWAKDETEFPEQTDIAIIGGGAIGSSVAYWLKLRDPGCQVHVIERDDTVCITFYSSSNCSFAKSSFSAKFVPEN